MDKLEEIFRMQDALNQRIGVHLPPPTDEEKAKWILNYTRAMQQETAELIDSVPWKWWAKYQKFDEQNARVEVVDLFHFLVSLAQTLGMTADDVYQAYLKKNAVNFQRQDSGYVRKDETDSKHIWPGAAPPSRMLLSGCATPGGRRESERERGEGGARRSEGSALGDCARVSR